MLETSITDRMQTDYIFSRLDKYRPWQTCFEQTFSKDHFKPLVSNTVATKDLHRH